MKQVRISKHSISSKYAECSKTASCSNHVLEKADDFMLEATFYNQLICIKNVANDAYIIVEDVVVVKNKTGPST